MAVDLDQFFSPKEEVTDLDAFFSPPVEEETTDLNAFFAPPVQEEEEFGAEEFQRGRSYGALASLQEAGASALDVLTAPQRMVTGLATGQDPDKIEAGLSFPSPFKGERVTVPTTQLADELREEAEFSRSIQQENVPSSGLGQFGVGIADSIINMGPSVLTSRLTKSGDAGLAVMAGTVYSQAFAKALADGVPDDQARIDAGMATLFEIGPEKMVRFYDKLGMGKGLRQVVRQGMREMPSEMLTESLSIAWEKYEKDESVGNFVDLSKRILEAGAAGFFVGGGISAPQAFSGGEIIPDPNAATFGGVTPTDTIDPQDISDFTDLPYLQRIAEDPNFRADEAAVVQEEQNVQYKQDLDLSTYELNGELVDKPAVQDMSVEAITARFESAEADRRRDLRNERRQRRAQEREAETARLAEASRFARQQELAIPTEGPQTEIVLTDRPEATLFDPSNELRDIAEAPQNVINPSDHQLALEDIATMPIEAVFELVQDQDLEDAYLNAEDEEAQLEAEEELREVATADAQLAYEQGLDRGAFDPVKLREQQAKEEDTRQKAAVKGLKDANKEGQEINLRLEANRVEATKLAEDVMGQEPSYYKKKEVREGKGKWTVTALEPTEGRVHVEWTEGANSYAASWIVGQPETAVHTLTEAGELKRTGPGVKGLHETKALKVGQRGTPRKGLKIPKAFKHDIDLIAAAVLDTGGRDTLLARARGGAVATVPVPFRGSGTIEQHVTVAKRRAVAELKAQAQKNYPPTEKQIANTEAQAEKAARGDQAKIRKIVGRGRTELEGVPAILEDRGEPVITLIEPAAKTRLKNGTTESERATQVTVNGGLRVVDIELNERRNRYRVTVVEVAGNKLKKDRILGLLPGKVPNNKKTFDARRRNEERKALVVRERNAAEKAASALGRQSSAGTGRQGTGRTRQQTSEADPDRSLKQIAKAVPQGPKTEAMTILFDTMYDNIEDTAQQYSKGTILRAKLDRMLEATVGAQLPTSPQTGVSNQRSSDAVERGAGRDTTLQAKEEMALVSAALYDAVTGDANFDHVAVVENLKKFYHIEGDKGVRDTPQGPPVSYDAALLKETYGHAVSAAMLRNPKDAEMQAVLEALRSVQVLPENAEELAKLLTEQYNIEKEQADRLAAIRATPQPGTTGKQEQLRIAREREGRLRLPEPELERTLEGRLAALEAERNAPERITEVLQEFKEDARKEAAKLRRELALKEPKGETIGDKLAAIETKLDQQGVGLTDEIERLAAVVSQDEQVRDAQDADADLVPAEEIIDPQQARLDLGAERAAIELEALATTGQVEAELAKPIPLPMGPRQAVAAGKKLAKERAAQRRKVKAELKKQSLVKVSRMLRMSAIQNVGKINAPFSMMRVPIEGTDATASTEFESDFSIRVWPEIAPTLEELYNAKLTGDIKAATPEELASTIVSTNPETLEEQAVTYELNTKDIHNKSRWSTYNIVGKAAKALWSKLSHNRGMSKKNKKRIVTTKFKEINAKATAAIQKTENLWLLTEGEINRAGIKRTTALDEAMTAQLNGMSPASAAKQFGVVVPASVTEYLNKIRSSLDTLSRLGASNGAFANARLQLVINNGRAYLHRTAVFDDKTLAKLFRKGTQTKSYSDFLGDATVSRLAEAYRNAWRIPETPQEIAAMSMPELLDTIQRHKVFTDRLSNSTYTDEDGKTHDSSAWIDHKGVKRQFAITAEGSKVPVTKKSGKVKKKQILATEEQLRDLIRHTPTSMDTYRLMMKDLLDGMAATRDRGGLKGQGTGADVNIQKVRNLLTSDEGAIRKILKQYSNTMSKTDKEKLHFSKDRWAEMSVDEFLTAFKTTFPDLDAQVEKTRKEVAFNFALRDAINDVTNPESLVGDTVSRLANTVFITEYLNTLLNVGKSEGWATSESGEAKRLGLIQMAPKDSSLGKTNVQWTDANGQTVYKQAHELYASPDVVATLKDLSGYGRQDSGVVMRGLMFWSGLAKFTNVIASPIAHPRNAVSTLGIHLARGGMLNIASRDTWVGTAAGISQLRAARSKRSAIKQAQSANKQAKWLINTMTDLGLMHDGGRAGAMQDIYSSLASGTDVEDVIGNLHRAPDLRNNRHASTNVIVRGGKALYGTTKRVAEESFRLEDEAVKGIALLSQTRDYMRYHQLDPSILDKAMTGEKLSTEDQATLDKALRVAAENVAQTYPTFSRAAPWVQWLSRMPVIGAFPTFTYEVARTTVNQTVYATRMLFGQTSDGKKIADPAMSARARTKGLALLGLNAAFISAGNALLAGVIGLMGDFLDGDDTDEDSDFFDELALSAIGEGDIQNKYKALLPWYSKDVAFTVHNVDKETGTFEWVDASYVLPTGGIEAAVRTATTDIMWAYNDNPEKFPSAVLAGLAGGFSDLFLNDEVMFGSIMDRFTRDDARRYEGKDAQKMLADGVDGAFSGDKVWQDFLGGTMGAAIENFPTASLVKQGNQFRLFMQDVAAGKYGTENDAIFKVGQSALKVGTGIKSKTFVYAEDAPAIFRSVGYDMRTADSTMREHLTMSKADSYEEFLSEFKQYNSNRYRKFLDVRAVIDSSYVTMDRSPAQVKIAMKTGGIDQQMAGMSRAKYIAGAYTPPSNDRMLDTIMHEDSGLERPRQAQIYSWYQQARQEEGLSKQ